ncbi:MAG: hypothetical protein CMI90_00225 [Pelagibacteraceae bacterium]|nr:hypothetical protein [Pelagibacteraceae bacterium]
MIKHKIQEKCIVCNGKETEDINLPKYPITEIFLETSKNHDEKQFFEDQIYQFCVKCNHAYLKKILDIRYVYQNYWTTTSASAGAINCLENFSKFINSNTNFENFSSFIDIGGNDSTFFKLYNLKDTKLINIDPNASGPENVILIKSFFDDMDLIEFKNDSKIICSSHTIEHLEDPNDLISKISAAMKDDDQCFLQFPSIEKQIEYLRFDQITHQHLNLFSLKSISLILKKYGLNIKNFEYDESLYGTLRVFCKKSSEAKQLSFVNIDKEIFKNAYEDFYNYYGKLNDTLSNLQIDFSGFGAGLMVPTLAYNLPFIKNLDFIFEENTEKFNKKFPNINAQIVSIDNMKKNSNIIITSVSTKISNRNIYNKLSKLGIKNIINPILIN